VVNVAIKTTSTIIASLLLAFGLVILVSTEDSARIAVMWLKGSCDVTR
jgi:hypothetical protein